MLPTFTAHIELLKHVCANFLTLILEQKYEFLSSHACYENQHAIIMLLFDASVGQVIWPEA